MRRLIGSRRRLVAAAVLVAIAGIGVWLPSETFGRSGPVHHRKPAHHPKPAHHRKPKHPKRPGVGDAPGPRVDPAPLVRVLTMATEGGQQGVELQTLRNIPVPGCPQAISGGTCFYPDPGHGAQWLQLVVLDRDDLGLVKNIAVNCPAAAQFPQEYQFLSNFAALNCVQSLVNQINGLNSGDLVIAVNQPGNGANKAVQPPVAVGAALSGSFTGGFKVNLGVDASGWFDSPDHGKNLPNAVRGTFSAIGVPGWTSGGVSNLADNPGAYDPQGAGRLDTYIARNNNARYAPFDLPAGPAKNSPVLKVLTQGHTDWPAATPGQAAAISAIGVALGLGSDPRSQYYSTTRNWALIQDELNSCAYTDVHPQTAPAFTARTAASLCGGVSAKRGTPPAFTAGPPPSCTAGVVKRRGHSALTARARASSVDFTRSDFNCAKDELSTEIHYLRETQDYVNILAKPYDGASQTLWSDFGTAVANVNSTTTNGLTNQALEVGRGVLEGVLDYVPGLGTAYKWGTQLVNVQSVLSAYQASLEVAETGSQPADGDFPVQAAQLGAQLTTRLNAAEEEIRTRFRNIIVADYGKLQTVDDCIHLRNACPYPGSAWSTSFDDLTHIKTALQLGLQSELYQKLVPAKYPTGLILSALDPAHPDLANNAANWCRPFSPFGDQTYVYLGDVTNQIDGGVSVAGYDPTLYITGDQGVAGPWEAMGMGASARMFTAVDPGGEFDKGGLGLDQKSFYQNVYLQSGALLRTWSVYARLTGCGGFAHFSGWTSG